MSNFAALFDELNAFLEACPADYDFPVGGAIGIPLPIEDRLLGVMPMVSQLEQDDLSIVRSSLGQRPSYKLATFAVRMAVYAARSRTPRIIEESIVAIMLDEDVLDWRDVITAMAIINDCASRLGMEIRSVIELSKHVATSRRWQTLVDGFLSRPPELRRVEAVGYSAQTGADGIGYVWTG